MLGNGFRSFGTKLLGLVIITSGVAVTLVCGAYVVNDLQHIQQNAVKTVQSHGGVIAIHSTAALAFTDQDAGSETLSALAAIPEVRSAYIHDADGELFAGWTAHGVDEEPPDRPHVYGHIVENNIMELSMPIDHDGEVLGSLLIHYDMLPVMQDMRRDALTGLTMGLAAMVVAVLLAWRLRVLISRPIVELVRTTHKVSQTKDYTVRARRMSNDELGDLTAQFNKMLERVHQRDIELNDLTENLEQRITDRTKALDIARIEAEAANKSKSDFLANMSHEIRTPMTAILGFADLLKDKSCTDDQRAGHVQTIRRNGEHLLNIINDILDLSKIEAGKFDVERLSFSPHQLLADVVSLMRVRSDAKGLGLKLEFDGPLPAQVTSDPTRLRQVLVNIAGNAIKFTQTGGLIIRVSLKEPFEEGDEHKLVVTMIDTGIGIDQDQINRLFRPFQQADETMTRKFGGTGLGLAISRSFAKMLGGDITCTSEVGKGSSFVVTVTTGSLDDIEMIEASSETFLRLHENTDQETSSATDDAAAAADVKQDNPEPLKDIRVLLCEDGVDNQRLISFLLKKGGADVVVAENGQIGLEAALEAREQNTPFDVILMDMQMPVLDGYGATAKLREAQYTGPIIALTAHAMSGDREKCIVAGCDDFQTKPIDRAVLINTVAKYAEAAKAA